MISRTSGAISSDSSGLYRWGPDGIFLKRGKQWHVRVDGTPPFRAREPDARSERRSAVFRKGAALCRRGCAVRPRARPERLSRLQRAPAVRRVRVRVLLPGGARAAGAGAGLHARIRRRDRRSGLRRVSHLGSLQLRARVLRATSRGSTRKWRRRSAGECGGGIWSDVARRSPSRAGHVLEAAQRLLIGPLVLLLWWRRRFWAGFVVGAVFAVTVAGLFGINALSSGEFNYQGGDRRTFYSTFPFDSPEHTWNRLAETRRSRRDDDERFGRRQRARSVGVPESLSAQPQVLSDRPAFRVRAVLFPRVRRHRCSGWRHRIVSTRGAC